MKKGLYIIAFLLTGYIASAQGFNYQAVARTASGTILASHAISVKITILDALSGGTPLYSETFAATTNQFGIFTLTIGTGTVVSGTFASIDWYTDQRFMDVAIDLTGGSTYADMGATQLLSVPFAKRTQSVTMFQSGTANPDYMVIQHSPQYPSYGLQYSDLADDFRFIGSGSTVLNVGLGSGQVGVNTTNPNATLDVNGTARTSLSTTSDWVQTSSTKVQSSKTDTANLIPIAYGFVDGLSGTPTILASTNNCTVTLSSTGSYAITIAGENYFYSNYNVSLTLVDAGFIAASSGSGKLFVYTSNTAGTAANARFYFTVYKP
ncbi:MAG: Protein of unknown function precursor [Bacteroidota bacterium]|nr:Protein of unknown function precursor [Bacteroidota bacterium]